MESKAYDTKGVSEWGRIEYEGNAELSTRSGNTEEPDETWNDWSPVANSGKIQNSSARFIQWKAVLTDKNNSLKNVRLAFLPQNHKPEIGNVELKGSKAPTAGRREGFKDIKWQADDIDEDSLVFNLYFKLSEEKGWTLLKGALRDTSYNIDPSVFPDGRYEFKVEVSDSLTNSIESYLKNESISEPCIIDNTGSDINIEVTGDRAKVTVTDRFNYIKSCEYTLDGGSWTNTFPVDRIFDSKEEEFSISIGKARKIVLRASDSSGNISLQSKLIK
jgi:hypothetical protein